MTQETKWTPGPWYVSAMNDALFVINQKPRPAPVDYINPNALEGVTVICGPVSRHDSHLIAAAPELYEALKYARRFLSRLDHDVKFVDGALAKARGETND